MSTQSSSPTAGSSRARATSPKQPRDPDLLGRYLSEVGRVPTPSRDRQTELARGVFAAKEAVWSTLLHGALGPAALDAVASHLDLDERLVSRARPRLSSAKDPACAQLIEAVMIADAGADQAARLLTALEENPALHPRGVSRVDAQNALEHARNAHRTLTSARNRLARENLRLVVKIAARFRGRGLPLEDLIQEGNIGLLRAADRYDLSRATRFSTYAALWIRHAVGRAVDRRSQLVRVPVHIRTLMRKAAKVRSRFSGREGRNPNARELAQELGVEEADLDWAEKADAGHAVSLSAPTTADGSRTLGDTLADDTPALAIEMDKAVAMEAAVESLDQLTDMERDILRRRFSLEGAEHESLRAIGEDYGLSRERIRQIQNRALQKLLHQLDRAGVSAEALAA